jgi:hypothetical protein
MRLVYPTRVVLLPFVIFCSFCSFYSFYSFCYSFYCCYSPLLPPSSIVVYPVCLTPSGFGSSMLVVVAHIGLCHYFLFLRNLFANCLICDFRLGVIAGRCGCRSLIWCILSTSCLAHLRLFRAMTFYWHFCWALLSVRHWLTLWSSRFLCSRFLWTSCSWSLARDHCWNWLSSCKDRWSWRGYHGYRCCLDSSRFYRKWTLIYG